jgi:hypothetical protein
MATLIRLVSLSMGLHLSCIASGLVLLEDEQKFNIGGCVGTIKHRFHAPTCRLNV